MLPRTRWASALVLALSLVLTGRAGAVNCAGDSTGLIPLTDLGSGFYMGQQGGLYPGALNGRPAAHDAAGITIAESIVPLDTLGQPDPFGRVILISIGMSNCTQEFSAFVPKAASDPMRSSNVRAIDCALGGQAANIIRDPNAAYWDTVMTRLRGRGSSPLQPQIVWIKQANMTPTGGFDSSRDQLTANLGAIVRIIHDKLPNVRLCYFTSRIYAGYADTPLNPEPYAYESGFAVKNLIAAQIAGVDSLTFDPDSAAVESPWLSWGPYLWADGLEGRSDGFTWACSNFSTNDGTHPSSTGRNVVADSLLAFFRADATTAPWYLSSTVSVPHRASGPPLSMTIAPNPTRGPVDIRLASPGGMPGRVEVLDAAGRRMRQLFDGPIPAGGMTIRWDARDFKGRAVPPSLYYVHAIVGGRKVANVVVVLEDPWWHVND